MSPPPEGRDRHYWPEGEPAADRLGATQVIPARGAPKITMPPPQSEDRMSLREKANAIFGEIGTRYEVTEVADNIKNAATGGSTKIGGGLGASVFDAVANLFGLADNAEKIAMAAQQQLQDITNETNTPGWSGYAWSSIFSGADGTPLPSTDWSTTNVIIAGDDGHAGLLHNSPDGSHLAVTQPIHQFTTDSQSASVVLGNKIFGSEDRWTTIRLRCNAAGTEGAVCWVRPGSIRIGRISGGTTTVWTTISPSTKSGDIVRFRCHGDNYYVLLNGVVILSWTDVGASVSKGAAFRHAAFSQEYLNGAFYDQASFRIASWAMADWLPPGGAVTTPSWQIRRGTNTAVALTVAHGGQALLPNNFYTITDRSTDVVIDLATGAATIQTDGWYEISATSMNRDDNGDEGFSGTPNGNTINAWRSSPWVLFVDGSAMIGPVMSGVAVKVYLAAGNVVRTGVAASSPNYPTTRSGDGEVANLTATSNISHVSGGPSASFTGRKLPD
ncbi:hypothetical protein PBI_PIPP_28 [Gordonia phage Pipp]|uniref:minor tail protein n=1 Tax=Gordonia phage Utz TaxID=1838081 RepID=UPI0007B6483D|nr:minor tail protein [Gordonia phage Utz]ANA86895.1 minor tail protein [Gordonia phage Utz]QFG09654.1 hypothetical protein PBI_PIPP_28 [Gordonia phage Pipp]